MAKINFMDRDNLLREFELTKDVITVGREATNEVVIPDPSVSRHHATIERREDGFHLVDKNSSNGTYVNGKRVSQQKLNDKDKVNFGSASVIFEDEEQGAATFILPRPEMPPPPAAAANPNERVTDALPPAEEMLTIDDDQPLPPPVPLLSMPSSRPQPSPPPAPQPPPPPAAAPAPPPPQRQEAQRDVPTPVGVLCPNCRKVVESGARFCGFCGTPLSSQKPAAPPAPAPPPAAPAPKPAPPAVAPAPPRPAPPPPAPKFQTMAAPAGGNLAAAAGGVIYGGFGVRLIAYLIDAVIVTILMLVVNIPTALIYLPTILRNEPPTPIGFVVLAACQLATFLVVLAYQVYFVGAKGATIGKKMMKLKVTMADGQYPIGYGKAFLRLIGYMISGLICYIGFLMIAFDKEQHRGLHDKIAGTVVIKES